MDNFCEISRLRPSSLTRKAELLLQLPALTPGPRSPDLRAVTAHPRLPQRDRLFAMARGAPKGSPSSRLPLKEHHGSHGYSFPEGLCNEVQRTDQGRPLTRCPHSSALTRPKRLLEQLAASHAPRLLPHSAACAWKCRGYF